MKRLTRFLIFTKKAYTIIGGIILSIGILFIPLLPFLIKGTCPPDINLAKLYLIFLFNSVISYFLFAYMTSLLVANQRNDVESSVHSLVKIFLTISQICILVVTKNYYLFAMMMPLFTIINNIIVASRVRKIFPQYKAFGEITNEDKSSIKRLVTGTFIQRVCVVTRNSLDSICISAFLGLTMTAIYNNYFIVINGITMFVSLVSVSFLGGVGNHVATKTIEENFNELRKLDFVYLWIGGWCTICLVCLFQPFMRIWMGEDMMLPMPVVLMLCLYFNMLKLGDMRTMYSSAKGLWWEHRYRSIVEVLLNLLLNLILGWFWGVYGIVIATLISLFLCNYIWATNITFRKYFTRDRIKDYYKYQGIQEIVTLLVGVITYVICSFVTSDSEVIEFILRIVICVVIPNVLYYLAYHNTSDFTYVKSKIFHRNSSM